MTEQTLKELVAGVKNIDELYQLKVQLNRLYRAHKNKEKDFITVEAGKFMDRHYHLLKDFYKTTITFRGDGENVAMNVVMCQTEHKKKKDIIDLNL